MLKKLGLCFLLSLLVFNIARAQDDPLATLIANASPHYYYDRETAFLLNYGLDKTHGGLYTAVDNDGSELGDLPVAVWGFPANYVRGTDKGLYAQATCVRYFITEYQRVTISGVGVAQINSLLKGDEIVDLDLLAAAQSCADFTIAHLEIDQTDDAIAEDSYTSGSPDKGDVAIPDTLFYWASTSTSGASRFVDDTNPLGQISAARAESVMAWSLAELALALKKADQPYQPYLDAALRWWDWRQTTAAPLPPYGDPNAEAAQNGCQPPADNPDNCIPGIGRDVFLPALGFTLSEITDDVSYRQIATDFVNNILGTADVPNLLYPPIDALQDGTYMAGYGRGIIFAKHDQQAIGALEDRDQWWDFGNYPARLSLDPRQNTAFSDNLGEAFAHFGGREVIAGTQRALWFYYTFGEAPNIFYAGTFSPAEKLRQPLRDYWDYTNERLWDDTTGIAAWFEAVNQPYKPCFSGGVDIPIADWLPPVIGSKTHTLNADGSALVTVTGVTDDPWDYLNWQFDGSSVKTLEIVYSIDAGQTWIAVPANLLPDGSYNAIIPVQPAGTNVLYYARAMDWFSNWTSFPAGAETRDTAGNIVSQDALLTQQYVIGG